MTRVSWTPSHCHGPQVVHSKADLTGLSPEALQIESPLHSVSPRACTTRPSHLPSGRWKILEFPAHSWLLPCSSWLYLSSPSVLPNSLPFHPSKLISSSRKPSFPFQTGSLALPPFCLTPDAHGWHIAALEGTA